jgi:hypothetical protein
MSRFDHQYENVFRAYRHASPDPEPSPDFMPGLWRKIDARRRSRFQFLHLSRLFLSGAAAVWLLIAGVLLIPSGQSPSIHQSYVDVLAHTEEAEAWSYAEVLHGEIGESGQR